jgi:hypothetical protein
MKRIILSVSLLVLVISALAQTQFRSNATGAWNANATWQQSADGIIWVAATSTPTSASGVVTIRSPHTVTVSSAVTIDETTIDLGATVIVSNTLTLANVANALTVNGTLSVTGTGAVSSPAVTALVFNATYTHNRNGGAIPTATWNTNSLCNVTGITGTVPTGLNPTGGFYDFTWNCAGQNANLSFAGSFVSVANDVLISTTNGQQLRFATNTGPTVNIGGNLTATGNTRLAFVTSGANAVINVGGNFNYLSTNTTGSPLKTTGSYTLNIGGNFDMNAVGGFLQLSNGNTTTGTVNLLGDFTLTAGTINEALSGRGAINFNKNGIQLFTNTGTISATIDFSIAASSTLDMLAESPIAGTGNLVVNGIVRLGSVNTTGALVAATNLGNIRNTVANRTYNPGSKVVYGGLAAQFIGSGHPISAGVLTEIDNASGVTFNTTTSGNTGVAAIISIPSNLILTNGNLNIASSAGIVRSLTLNGNVTASGNSITFSGNTSDLVINGTGAFGAFPFPAGSQTIRDFTLNRTSSGSVSFNNALTILGIATLTNGTVTFLGSTSIASNVSLATGTVLAFDGQSLSMAGNFTSTGLLSASGASTLSLTGGTALTSALNFSPTNHTLTSFTINKSNAGISATISSPLNVTSTLTITNGRLDITGSSLTMGNPSTINLSSAGSITTSAPAGGPWNLNYSGTANINPTGFEIPVSGSLLSLSSTNTATITLDQSLTIGTGGFTLNASGGAFTAVANAISTSFLTVTAGTFTAPSSTLTLTGNLSNSGTYTHNSGTLIFNGVSSILGINASTTNFNSVTINSGMTLTLPTTFNVQGNLQNNGSFVTGSGTVAFSGNTAKQITGTSKIIFKNITVNNGTQPIDLSLETAIGADITGILTMGATAVFDTDGVAPSSDNVFTLLSTADKPTVDASIAALPGAGLLPGKITVQRYMNKQGVVGGVVLYNVWRNISSPVNTTLSDIQPELPVTGSFTGNNNAAIATTIPSMFTYNEAVITDTDGTGIADLDDGFTAFPVAANTETLVQGKGYSIFVFNGDEPVLSNNNSKWDMRGTIRSGTFSLPVTRTPSGPGATYVAVNDGWNLVGNPYPSTIDWASANWIKTNVDNAIYMSDYSTANPVFASWINTPLGPVTNNNGTSLIAIGQGFWVKANAATAASPVLTIQESVKVAGTQTTFFRQAAPPDLIRVTLSKDDLKDETVVYFADSSTVDFDSEYDALKLMNPYGYLNLSSVSPALEKYAINGLPFSASTCAKQVSLDVSDVVTGTYQLSFTEFESMSASMMIQFKDNFTNTVVDARQNPSYSFAVDDTNPATFGANRFSLSFTYQAAPAAIQAAAADVCDATDATVTITSSLPDFNYSLVSPTDGFAIGSLAVGNTGLLDLVIPSDKLTDGLNTFQVKAANRYCSTLISTSSVSLKYSAAPTEPTVVSASTCGTGQATLSATGAPSDGHYSWYDSLSANVAIANEILASFKTPVLTTSKEYYVSAVNSLGCEGPRAMVMATVANPAAAQITSVDLFTLQSNYDTGNQWYYNGVAIAGATGKTLKVDKSGQYGLDVKVGDCTVSDKTDFIVLAVEDSLDKGGIKIYPNPVKEFLKVEVFSASEPKSIIFNLVGQEAGNLKFEKTGESYSTRHDVRDLGAGVYFLKVVKDDRVSVIRIIKD